MGVNVAVSPEPTTVPTTATPPGPVKVNVPVVIVAGFIVSLNVAVITEVKATPVVAFAGTTLTTIGGTAGVCSRPHPPITPVASSASTQKKRTISLLMKFSYSLSRSSTQRRAIAGLKRRERKPPRFSATKALIAEDAIGSGLAKLRSLQKNAPAECCRTSVQKRNFQFGTLKWLARG